MPKSKVVVEKGKLPKNTERLQFILSSLLGLADEKVNEIIEAAGSWKASSESGSSKGTWEQLEGFDKGKGLIFRLRIKL